jgi:hypothetical protein
MYDMQGGIHGPPAFHLALLLSPQLVARGVFPFFRSGF